MRKIYLKTKRLDEAIQLFDKALFDFYEKKEVETIPVRSALGRVSAKAIYAKKSSPSFHSCAMDGIMVKSSSTALARDHEPLLLKKGEFEFCDTGDPLVPPFDSVVMIEDIVEKEEGVELRKAVYPWEHVRPIGEDIIEKDLLFTQEHEFTPIELSVLLAAGIREIEVYKKPRIALLPTGDEIVDGEEELAIGQIIESNTAMFEAMAFEAGAEVLRYPILKDDRKLLKQAVEKAINESDVVAMLAGSSAGRDDYTVEIAKELGDVHVHGISIRPGKPAVLATIAGKPFVGIPGYPVSGHIVFEEIIAPLLRKKAHRKEKEKEFIQGRLTRRVTSSLKHQEYIRVKIGKIQEEYSVTPMERGAGASLSLALSDGYLVIPQHSEGILRGEMVEVRLHHPLRDLDKRLVSIGSHDMVLDLINNLFAQEGKGNLLISSHVGSFAGLQSLVARECHLAPSHLLSKDGSYNRDALDMLFKGQRMAMIKVVGRRQGIILPKGNPKGIRGLGDLPGKSMVNRQRGAGTRVFFDYLLEREGIDPSEFPGYDHELTTHLAVALAVKHGDADFGIGVESAALKLDCDFVYLGDEDYDFICYEETLEKREVKELLELLASNQFKEAIMELGGYETTSSGRVEIYEG